MNATYSVIPEPPEPMWTQIVAAFTIVVLAILYLVPYLIDCVFGVIDEISD